MSSSPAFRSAQAAEKYLLGFINYELQTRYRPTTRTHDLERIARVLRDLGWKPRQVPTLHIGGTNAKGSVAWLIERLLRESPPETSDGTIGADRALAVLETVRPATDDELALWCKDIVIVPGIEARLRFPAGIDL